MSVCKVGDCLINRQTKEVFEIISYCGFQDYFIIQSLDNTAKQNVYAHVADRKDFTYLNMSCPVAQLLYSNKSMR